MTAALLESLPDRPGPDTPVIAADLIVNPEAPNARYSDMIWPLSPLNANPSASRNALHLDAFPEPLREEFTYLVWSMINRALPDDFLVGRVPTWRTRQSPGKLYATVQRWRALAEWLVKRDITTLAQCTTEDVRAFALDNLRTPKSREYAGSFLTSISRLWAFDFYGAQPLGIGEPPWHWEGIDDFLPAATARGENATEPITAATMGPLLIWALRVVDDFAEDIMSAWEKAAEMTARAEATVTNKLGLARIKDYVDARRDRGEPIPSWVQSHGPTECIPYISALTGASMGQVDRVLRRGYRSEYARANLGPSSLKLKIKGRIDGTPWTKAIDFGDVDSLMRHLGTACFIVLAYLTGMRPGEVLSLHSGSCPEPDSGPHLIYGNVYKTARDEDGNYLSKGTLREMPWVAIAPAVSAIRVLEQIVPEGNLLFDAHAHDFRLRRKFTGSITYATMSERIEAFATWASDQATRLKRPQETVPADPHGAIGTERFRRTLAWHIARRPGGLVALAIQYGHMRTVVSVGYASRSRDGIHDLLDIETARATVDTLATLNADLSEGVGISGPAARRAINAAAHAPEFIGTVISVRTAQDILDNSQLSVYDNPGSYLMCVYNRDKALCHRLEGQQEAPSLERCQPSCANITRTDHHAEQLIALAEQLEKQALSELVPVPLADRFRRRASHLRSFADEHYRNRVTVQEDPS
ncbi:integrase [Streptomyces sp. NPDC092952]|uniref:integrase n=1 Tax=Streptomyces sp. NPDC092952 TaxID=3366018 RepID=UPI0038177FD9